MSHGIFALGHPAPKAGFSRDARRRKRANLNLSARLWPFEPKYRHLQEVRKIKNFTRDGLYFSTHLTHYFIGMKVLVTFPFSDKAPVQNDYLGAVVRLERLSNGMIGVALRFIF